MIKKCKKYVKNSRKFEFSNFWWILAHLPTSQGRGLLRGVCPLLSTLLSLLPSSPFPPGVVGSGWAWSWGLWSWWLRSLGLGAWVLESFLIFSIYIYIFLFFFVFRICLVIILFVYFFVYFILLCVHVFVYLFAFYLTLTLNFCVHLFFYSFFIVQIQTVIGSCIQYFQHIKDYG